MANKKTQWILLGVLIFLSILLYTNIIIRYWPRLLFYIIQFLSTMEIKGQMVTTMTIIFINFVGILIIALLFSFPLGYIIKERPIYFGFLLGLGPLLYLLGLHIQLYQNGTFTKISMFFALFEYIGIILAFIFMSKVGAYVRSYRERKIT